ncbi:hypothetical protein [Faecalibacterium sp. An121]|uniref:hypothetical protein n=1 Tax=Faecalibacterium sp. An121 TaxID=1965550 RepID=UPI000B3A82AA|nr:hypothetical protein [Faecalibacterium sp. An121]OUQ33537.1 hypothetical protein B5E66_12655 [Faecalibacterium sp. An121]
MKLKKIASLALAGIMAVSMLTACGEGTGNGNSGSSSSEPTAPTGYTATIYSLLNSKSKSVMSSEASNILSLAVDASAKALDNDTFKESNKNLSAVDVQGHVSGNSETAVSEMGRNVDGKWSVYGIKSGEDDDITDYSLTLNDGDTKVFVMLAPTSLNDTQINSGVAGIVNGLVEDLDTNNKTSTVSYKMSADRELIGSSNAGIYLIAVAISMNETAKA